MTEDEEDGGAADAASRGAPPKMGPHEVCDATRAHTGRICAPMNVLLPMHSNARLDGARQRLLPPRRCRDPRADPAPAQHGQAPDGRRCVDGGVQSRARGEEKRAPCGLVACDVHSPPPLHFAGVPPPTAHFTVRWCPLTTVPPRRRRTSSRRESSPSPTTATPPSTCVRRTAPKGWTGEGGGGCQHLCIPHLRIPHLRIAHLCITHLRITHLRTAHLRITHLSARADGCKRVGR